MKMILFLLALISISVNTRKVNSILTQISMEEMQFNLNAVVKASLDAHNAYRAKHKAPPLVLDPALNKISQNFANLLASKGSMYHSSNKYLGSSLGENIYKCWGCKIDGKSFTASWYNEVSKYDFKGKYIPGTGHFTQIVWKNSKKLGVGVAQGKDGSYVVVANYYPPGNMLSQMAANVLR